MSQILNPSSGGGSGSGSSYALSMITAAQSTVNDSTTYFMASGGVWSSTGTVGQVKLWIPKSGTLTSVYGSVNYAGAGSSENVTINVRLNNTTDFTITSTAQFNSNPTVFSNNAMSVTVSEGDFISFTIVTPVWVTNPTTCTFSATAFIS